MNCMFSVQKKGNCLSLSKSELGFFYPQAYYLSTKHIHKTSLPSLLFKYIIPGAPQLCYN